jgi:hypothetical protein
LNVSSLGNEDLVRALRVLSGVADAEIIPDERANGAGTLRLSLAPGADEVAVATEVNRILRDRFGLGVDAGRVHVVEETTPTSTSTPALSSMPESPDKAPRYLPPLQSVPALPVDLASPPPPAFTEVPDLTLPPPPVMQSPGPVAQAEIVTRGGRLLIHRLQLVSAGLGVTAAVTLGLNDDEYTGEADGAATPASVYQSVAAATLRAVETVVAGNARLSLEQVEIATLGSDRVALVAVSLASSVGSERLTGAAVVRDDVRQAVIRATLDAVNRRMQALSGGV